LFRRPHHLADRRFDPRARRRDTGYFVEPTVITGIRPEMAIVREEIFGPVVVAAPFQSLEEIAAQL
jgi:phenylacetaldehyde dehydrogenase